MHSASACSQRPDAADHRGHRRFSAAEKSRRQCWAHAGSGRMTISGICCSSRSAGVRATICRIKSTVAAGPMAPRIAEQLLSSPVATRNYRAFLKYDIFPFSERAAMAARLCAIVNDTRRNAPDELCGFAVPRYGSAPPRVDSGCEKRQPAGGFIGVGISPLRMIRLRRAPGTGTGTADSSASV